LKAAFVYDHDFIETEHGIYSSGAFQQSSWKRYLAFFSELTVIANKKLQANETMSSFNKVDAPSVQFYFVKPIKTLSAFISSLLFRNRVLEQEIQKHDAVIIRMYSELGLKAIAIARKLKKPYAIEVVGCPWDAFWNHPSLQGKVLAPYAWFRMKRAIRQAPFVLYVTREFLQRRYPANGQTSYASNVMLPPVDERRLDERMLKIQSGLKPFKIGVVGKVDVVAKGIHILLMAVSKIKDQLEDFQVIVVGPGDIKKLQQLAVESGIGPRVVFKGKIPSGKPVTDFMDDIDLYVHPSMQEGLPRSVIEAMSRACPVLASSTAGTPELLDNAFLHEPGNVNMIASQILNVFNSRELLKKMASDNFRMANAYSAETLNERRKEFWSKFHSYALQFKS
jgi:glycosyltransferase involved in cell wall biosynthesis